MLPIFYFMKDFEITCDWIDRYNDDELDEFEKSFFQQQMLHNPMLRAEVYIDARLNRLFSDEDVLELMQKVQSVTKKNNQNSGLMSYMAIAASVISLLVLGAILFLVDKKPVNLPAYVRQQITLPVKKQTQDIFSHNNVKSKQPPKENTSVNPREISGTSLLADKYKPLAAFELLVGSVTRSTQIRLITPAAKIQIQAGIPVRFSWNSQTNQHPVSIVIINNLGTLIFEAPSLHANEYLLQTNMLLQGLYYWKIMDEDELVMMGKLTLY